MVFICNNLNNLYKSKTYFSIYAGETDEGVGTPYNVAHNFHVEFHADIGFTV